MVNSDKKTEILQALDIVDVIGRTVNLTRQSHSLYTGATSPLSNSGASLKVDQGLQLWHDLSGRAEPKGGDVFSWIAYEQKLNIVTDFPEILRMAADIAGVQLENLTDEQVEKIKKKQMLQDILTKAAYVYHSNLTPEIRTYINKKWGITNETIDRLKIGYAKPGNGNPNFAKIADCDDWIETGLFTVVPVKEKKENEPKQLAYEVFRGRVVFPYWNGGKVVNFAARGDFADPVNTPDNQYEKNGNTIIKYKKLLTHNEKHPYVSEYINNGYIWGEDSIKGNKFCVITEGIADAIVLMQNGYPVLSPVTTKFAKHDIEKLMHIAKKLETVYICNDNENSGAGEDGAIRTGKLLTNNGLDVKIMVLPKGSLSKIDVAEFFLTHTKNKFEEVKNQAKKFIPFMLERVKKDCDLVEKQKLAIQFIDEYLTEVSGLDREAYIDENIKKHFGFTKEQINSIKQNVNKKTKKTQAVEKHNEQSNNTSELDQFILRDDGIFKMTYDKEGGLHEKRIAASHCSVVAIGRNIDTQELLYKLRIQDLKGAETFIWKTTGALMKKTEVLKLQEVGMHFKEVDANDVIEYLDAYIVRASSNLKEEFTVSTGGWKKNFSMYVIGNRCITSDSVSEIVQMENPTAINFEVQGTLEDWVKGAKYIIDYPAVRFKVYNAFAAPLLRMLKLTSYLLDNHVETGRLKSVSNALAAGCFGKPWAQQVAGSSTSVGVLGMLTYCIDIPTFMDETSQNVETARKLAYSVGNVGKRVKGKSDGKAGIVIPSEMSTVLLMTGENPIIPENSNGGEDVRVLPLTEGVSAKLSPEDISSMELLLSENYGHLIVPFIQEVLKRRNEIPDIFKQNLSQLPASSSISEDRVKKQYSVAATAGAILEKIFENIGITPVSPLETVTRYYEMNVARQGFTPDHIKILRSVYNWYAANAVYFEDDIEIENGTKKAINHTRYGWIRDFTGHGQSVCFIENPLKEFISKEFGSNKYETAMEAWKNEDILLSTTKNEKGKTRKVKTREIKVSHEGKSRIQVIAVPLQMFMEKLDIFELEASIVEKQSDAGQTTLDVTIKAANTETTTTEAQTAEA